MSTPLEEIRAEIVRSLNAAFNARRFVDPDHGFRNTARTETRKRIAQLRAFDDAVTDQQILQGGGVQQKARLDERTAAVRWLYAHALTGDRWQRALAGVLRLAADCIEHGEHLK